MITDELDDAIVILGEMWPEYINTRTLVGRRAMALLHEVEELSLSLKKSDHVPQNG